MDITDKTDREIKIIITELMIKIGCKPNMIGFHYSRVAIFYIYKHNYKYGKITTEVYGKVAEEFKVTPHMVQNSIRIFVNNLCSKGKPEELNSMFKMRIYKPLDPPTSCEFLSLMVELLKRYYHEQ